MRLTAAAAFAAMARLAPSPFLVVAIASAFFTTRAAEVWVNSWNLISPMSLLQAAAIGWLLTGALTWRSSLGAIVIAVLCVLNGGQGWPQSLRAPFRL